MDGYLALTIIIAIIVIGNTISSVVDSKNPRPQKSLTKFDAINAELKRLHDDADDYISCPAWLVGEIQRLNTKLIEMKEDEK